MITTTNTLLLQQHRYRIDKKLGSGGEGEVYLAYDNKLLREVAIKIIPFKDENTFIEAQALAKLDSPLVVTVFDVFHNNQFVAIVIEPVHSCVELDTDNICHMKENEFFPLYLQVLKAVQDIHEAGLLHLDLKPDNILVNKNSKVKIADFGISIDLEQLNTTPFSKQDNLRKGSWYCISPEQLLQKQVSDKTDVFALGVFLFTFIYGRHPFIVGGDQASTRDNILKTNIQFNSIEKRDYKPAQWLYNLVLRMLDKNPKKRPSTQEVIEKFKVSESFTDPGSLETQTLIFPKNESTKPIKRIVGVAAFLTISFSLSYYFLKPQPIKTTLVVPTLKITNKDNPTKIKFQDNNLLVATILEDELEAAVITDPRRKLVSKKEWSGSHDWKLEAKQIDVDEILISDVSCGETFCKINISLFDSLTNRHTHSITKSIPHSDLMILGSVIEQTLTSQIGLDNKKKEFRAITDKDLREYYHYRVQANKKEVKQEDLEKIQLIIVRNPSFLGAHILLGHYYLAIIDNTNSSEWLAKGQQHISELKLKHPKEPSVLKLDFDIQILLGNIEQAETTLSKLTRIAGIDTSQLYLLDANLQFNRNKLKGYQRLLSHESPRLTNEYFRYKARMENDLTYLESLEQTAAQWSKLFPKVKLAKFYLASSYLYQGKLNNAIEVYQTHYDTASDSDALINIAICYQLLRDYRNSLAAYRKAINIAPNSIYALLGLAEVLKSTGNIDSGHYFYKALELLNQKKNLSEIDFAYQALIYAHISENDSALISLQKAARSENKSGSFYLIAAYTYSLLEKHDAALYNARQAQIHGFRLHWFELPWTQHILKAASN